jgi:hypothetical protein
MLFALGLLRFVHKRRLIQKHCSLHGRGHRVVFTGRCVLLKLGSKHAYRC